MPICILMRLFALDMCVCVCMRVCVCVSLHTCVCMHACPCLKCIICILMEVNDWVFLLIYCKQGAVLWKGVTSE